MPDLVNVNRIDPSKSRKMSITSDGCCADNGGPTNGLTPGRLQCWEGHVPDCDHMTTHVGGFSAGRATFLTVTI